MLYLLPLGIMCILCLNNKFVGQNYKTVSIVMIVHVEYNGDNTFSIVQAFLRCCTLEQSLLCYTGQVGPYINIIVIAKQSLSCVEMYFRFFHTMIIVERLFFIRSI